MSSSPTGQELGESGIMQVSHPTVHDGYMGHGNLGVPGLNSLIMVQTFLGASNFNLGPAARTEQNRTWTFARDKRFLHSHWPKFVIPNLVPLLTPL